jgi:uncharacterized protein (DUF433 family)
LRRATKTDGAEILYDFGQTVSEINPEAAKVVEDLAVVRNQQRVFAEVVGEYLRSVSYRNGWVELIHLHQYADVDVIVDPQVNFGKPTVASRGVRVDDIVARVKAGESLSQVAWDYKMRADDVEALTHRAA